MKPSSEIPRPAGSLLNHSLRFFRNTMQFYEDAHRECGDLFATRIPGMGEWVYVCSPEMAEAVVQAPPDELSGGDLGGFNLIHVQGPGAASHLDGPALKERRDVTAPYLSASAGLKRVDDFRAIAERRIAEWPVGQPFKLVLSLQKIALESLMRVFFSGASPERIRQLSDVYEDFSFKGLRSPATPHSSLQVDLGPWSLWGQVLKRQRAVFAAFSQEIEARLAAAPEEDGIVPALGRAGLAPEVIRAELLDLLFQGHEMTGDGLTWIYSELLANPEKLGKLREEVVSVVGSEGIRAGDLDRLPYLQAVIFEGLRRRPTNFITSVRRVKKPFPLGGYLLPEGTLVAVCYPALAKRADLYPDPQRFQPERQAGQGPTGARCPFGSGAHACPGRELAMVILKTVLATVVRGAELKAAQALEELRPVRVAYFYEPNKGLQVTLEKRL
jgi:cytochrome P450